VSEAGDTAPAAGGEGEEGQAEVRYINTI